MTGRRIHFFHDYLLSHYGQRVQKLCLDGGFTCPNRDGSKAVGGCVFCDVGGSGAAHIAAARPIREQIATQKAQCRARYGASIFIAYFQAFTNTYAPLERLKSLYDEALEDSDIVGLSVGTRADCLSPSVCDLLASYRDKGRRVWVEIGVQTVNQETLDRMNRAELVDDFRRAAKLVKERGLDLVVHVIVGLPGDTAEDFYRTIGFVNEVGADGIKIHNLYVDARAPLAKWWRDGQLKVLTLEEYAEAVATGLEQLCPACLIHRLSGQAPRPYHLAPDWALDKNRVIHAIEKVLERRGTAHGSAYSLERSVLP
jgi:radical SAM protein (TIGR01212 family)